jgi:tellurite resistance protein
LLLGLRLWRWQGAEAIAPSGRPYTFGIAATTVCGLKRAIAGSGPAQHLALPIFIGAKRQPQRAFCFSSIQTSKNRIKKGQ